MSALYATAPVDPVSFYLWKHRNYLLCVQKCRPFKCDLFKNATDTATARNSSYDVVPLVLTNNIVKPVSTAISQNLLISSFHFLLFCAKRPLPDIVFMFITGTYITVCIVTTHNSSIPSSKLPVLAILEK
ncbi:hypothetical protein BD770DRAFT_430597 [Pilaira anomala]|nr:hypothetical protein BD770DRAFT_430597 [Pilaira anomala]